MRGGDFARWWVDRYTRGLAPEVRDRRRAEIESDVYEHAHSEVASDGSVLWRTLRGVPADLSWRRDAKRAIRGERARVREALSVVTQSWFAPLVVLVGVFDLLLAWGVATETSGKLPGRAVGPAAMAAVGACGFVGLWMRWRSRPDGRAEASSQPPPRWARPWPAVAVALVAVAVGFVTGWPAAFYVGFAVFVVTALSLGAVAVVRSARSWSPKDRGALADGLIIVAMLPALAFFWMVVPALIAIAVIAGIAGVGRRAPTP
jgi:hypothetical protein